MSRGILAVAALIAPALLCSCGGPAEEGALVPLALSTNHRVPMSARTYLADLPLDGLSWRVMELRPAQTPR